MELELSDKQLPERVTAQAVAGYLYFPVATGKRKTVAYELEYEGRTGRMVLEFGPMPNSR